MYSVINSENEWVQVSGSAGVCDLYSSRYGAHPLWGETGNNNEEATRHIMCCLKNPLEDGSIWDDDEKIDGEHVIRPDSAPANWEEFDYVTNMYKPVWYDRQNGWDGQSYQDSLDFCDKQMDGYMPCPLDAVSF